MRDQRDPTADRVRELLEGDPSVIIDWGQASASSLDPVEIAGIEGVADLMEEGKRLLSELDLNAPAAAAADLDGRLAELGTRVGAQLRALNRTGIFLSAHHGPKRPGGEDPAAGYPAEAAAPAVRLKIHRPATAA